jgi:dihydropyrimidine dehydrogenase (NAD+) subunit PreA
MVGKRVKETDAHGLVIINRIPALEVDIKTGRLILVGGFAGYGGPWMRPIMLRLVAMVAKEVGLPISATNGIWVWEDVVKTIMCGAHDVQTCTGIIYGRKGLGIVKDYIKGLKNYLVENNIPSVNQLRGISISQIKTRAEVDRRPKGTIWSKVIAGKSTACKLCGNWCYYHAISFNKKGKAVIDKARCDGCMLCRVLCPKEAIVERGELPIYLGDFK